MQSIARGSSRGTLVLSSRSSIKPPTKPQWPSIFPRPTPSPVATTPESVVQGPVRYRVGETPGDPLWLFVPPQQGGLPPSLTVGNRDGSTRPPTGTSRSRTPSRSSSVVYPFRPDSLIVAVVDTTGDFDEVWCRRPLASRYVGPHGLPSGPCVSGTVSPARGSVGLGRPCLDPGVQRSGVDTGLQIESESHRDPDPTLPLPLSILTSGSLLGPTPAASTHVRRHTTLSIPTSGSLLGPHPYRVDAQVPSFHRRPCAGVGVRRFPYEEYFKVPPVFRTPTLGRVPWGRSPGPSTPLPWGTAVDPRVPVG